MKVLPLTCLFLPLLFGCLTHLGYLSVGEAEVLSDEKKQELCDLGATLRTIRGDSVVKDAPRGKKNYQIKVPTLIPPNPVNDDLIPSHLSCCHQATAILESSFREVVYLDSDNIPVAPLLEVFDSPGYKRLGAMFWPVSSLPLTFDPTIRGGRGAVVS